MLHTRPMKTLHVVDGESTGGTLRVAGFRKNGEILVWRDALYTGLAVGSEGAERRGAERGVIWADSGIFGQS